MGGRTPAGWTRAAAAAGEASSDVAVTRPGADFRADLQRALLRRYGRLPSWPTRVYFAWTDPAIATLACLRWDRYARQTWREHRILGLPLTFFGRLWRRRQLRTWHVDICPSAQIGPGLVIAHAMSIVVGPVRIGSNCVLHQHVTLGERVSGGDHGVPTLGDNVWIGPGAVISGDVSIGNNVTISAGTILSRSIPDGCLVGGNPGRVINTAYDNGGLHGPLLG